MTYRQKVRSFRPAARARLEGEFYVIRDGQVFLGRGRDRLSAWSNAAFRMGLEG